ncbi:MAG: coproporphyrinogen-III oxidase family protein, partial [Pirellulaceae bacterium]
REAGLTVALDLIFAAPGETVAAWQSDIESALCLRPDHLSIYGLTWERGTNFWGRRLRGELAGCDETAECIMYEWAIDRLLAAGYEHYEVSNFARPGHRCRHNEAYWMGRTYYAFGPGAARHVAGRREVNHRSTTTYIRRVLAGQSPVAESEFLTPAEAARERLVFGLRRLEGIAPDVFATETGFRLTDLAGPTLDRYCRSGWLEWQAGSLRLTRAGLLLSDALWPELLV